MRLASPELSTRFAAAAPIAAGLASLLEGGVKWFATGRIPPDIDFTGTHVRPLSCPAHFAFWQLAAGSFSFLFALGRELAFRRSFLAENWQALGLGLKGKKAAAQWPLGHMGGFVTCWCLLAGIFFAYGIVSTSMLLFYV